MPSFNLTPPTRMTASLATAIQNNRDAVLPLDDDGRDAICRLTAAAFLAATPSADLGAHCNCDSGDCFLCHAECELASEIEYLLSNGYPEAILLPDGTTEVTR